MYRGKYANNTQWSYDTKTKTVTIECRGELPDDHHGSAGWRDYYLKAKKVIFKKGITSIGEGAFYNFQKLEEVVLPEGLKTIKDSAFFKCNGLKKIKPPTSLRTIGGSAFSETEFNAFSLERVKKIGNMCFSGSKIKEVYISKDCRAGSLVFMGSKKLKKATINEGVKKIGKEAFSCTTLEEITIPSTVTQLGKNAFRWESTEKSSLKKVVIRSKNIKKWGTMVFGATRDDLVIYVPQSKKAEYEKILRSTNGLDFHAKIVGKNW